MPSVSNFMSEANKVETHDRASVLQNRNASPNRQPCNDAPQYGV